MSPVDVIVVAAVAVVFALCVRAIVRSQRAGECADCATGGSCDAHRTGQCQESAELRADAVTSTCVEVAGNSLETRV